MEKVNLKLSEEKQKSYEKLLTILLSYLIDTYPVLTEKLGSEMITYEKATSKLENLKNLTKSQLDKDKKNNTNFATVFYYELSLLQGCYNYANLIRNGTVKEFN